VPSKGGVFVYVGKTQSGKTTKALEDARADIREDGRPCLIVDLGPAINFRGTRHEPDRFAVLTKLYGEHKHAVYSPIDMDDFDGLIDGVSSVGDCHVILDEVRWIANFNRISPALTKALRHWAHGKKGPVTYRCTSQRPGDLHRDFYACLTGELYAFRVDPGLDQDRLVKECGFDPDVLGNLPRGGYVTFSGEWKETVEPYETVDVPETKGEVEEHSITPTPENNTDSSGVPSVPPV